VLYLPSTDRQRLRDLSGVAYGELSGEYLQDLQRLREHVTGELRAKTSEGGHSFNGPSLAGLLRALVLSASLHAFPRTPSLWYPNPNPIPNPIPQGGLGYQVGGHGLHRRLRGLLSPSLACTLTLTLTPSLTPNPGPGGTSPAHAREDLHGGGPPPSTSRTHYLP
jgi:hypothetical protein